MVDVVSEPVRRIVRHAHHRIGSRRSGQTMTVDEESGDWAADQARDH